MSGVRNMVAPTTMSMNWAVGSGTSASVVARATMTNANSPPCPSSSPISTACPRLKPKRWAMATMSIDLIANRPTTERRIHKGSVRISVTSMIMPTDMKKSPSSSPLNGSMFTSIS